MTNYNIRAIIITESTDDGRSLRIWLRNNRLQFGRWAVISFYLRSLKYLYNKSAKAINMLIIINDSVKVMYSILSTSLPCSEGSRNMLPSKKGRNRHRMVFSEYFRTDVILSHSFFFVNIFLLRHFRLPATL